MYVGFVGFIYIALNTVSVCILIQDWYTEYGSFALTKHQYIGAFNTLSIQPQCAEYEGCYS